MQTKITNPETADSMEDLESKFEKWEKDLRVFLQIGGKDITDEQKASIILQIVPDALREQLIQQNQSLESPDKLEAEIRRRIILYGEHKSRKAKSKKALGAVDKPEDEQPAGIAAGTIMDGKGYAVGWDTQGQAVWDDWYGYIMMAVPAPKRARVDDETASQEDSAPNPFTKGKGKGKSKGAPKGCWTCGSTEHLQRQCPHNYYMPKTTWNGWYPFKGLQGSKGKGKGVGKGKGKGKGKSDTNMLNMPMQYHQLGSVDYWGNQYESHAIDHTRLLGHVGKGPCMAAENISAEDIDVGSDNAENTSWKRVQTAKSKQKFTKTNLLAYQLHSAMSYRAENRFSVLESEDPDVPISSQSAGDVELESLQRQNSLHTSRALAKRQIPKRTPANHRLHRDIGVLTKISNPTIAPVGKEQCEEWKRVSITIDSGACDNVMNPLDAPNCELKQTRASMAGEAFASATGEAIPNLGELEFPFQTQESGWCKMRMQACEVSKPLASVMKICAAGHQVVFDADGSYIINKYNGEINYLREENGNYLLDVWVPPKSHDSTFTRPQ